MFAGCSKDQVEQPVSASVRFFQSVRLSVCFDLPWDGGVTPPKGRELMRKWDTRAMDTQASLNIKGLKGLGLRSPLPSLTIANIHKLECLYSMFIYYIYIHISHVRVCVCLCCFLNVHRYSLFLPFDMSFSSSVGSWITLLVTNVYNPYCSTRRVVFPLFVLFCFSLCLFMLQLCSVFLSCIECSDLYTRSLWCYSQIRL